MSPCSSMPSCTRQLEVATELCARSTRFRSTSRGGGCRWSVARARRAPPADLQGRGRGDASRSAPATSRRRGRRAARPRATRAHREETAALNAEGLRVVAVAATRNCRHVTDGLSRGGRERPDAARLHRVPRPAEGDRGRGDRGAGRAGRGGQDPDRRQRGHHAQDLPGGGPASRATCCSARDVERMDDAELARGRGAHHVFAKLTPVAEGAHRPALHGARATWSASSATASTTPRPCTRPMSASPSTPPSTSPRNPPTSSCWRRA